MKRPTVPGRAPPAAVPASAAAALASAFHPWPAGSRRPAVPACAAIRGGSRTGLLPAGTGVLATSYICSGNGPVLPDGESLLATAVLTRRNIRGPKGPFHLPDDPFPGACDLIARQREHGPLALSERKTLSGKKNGAFWQYRLSEARGIQGQRSVDHRQ
jgi:hypothetical protein